MKAAGDDGVRAEPVEGVGAISAGGTNEGVVEALVRFCRGRQGAGPVRILELGSGRGHLATMVRRRLEAESLPFEYQCTDIDPDQINSLNAGLSCRFLDVQGPFNLGAQYDVVLAVEIVEHIENPFHFLREISQVLAQGGLFVMTSPNTLCLSSRVRFLLTGCFDYFRRPFNEYHLNMGHLNPVSTLLATYILRKNGFEVVRVSCNRWSIFASLLWLPLIPFIAVSSWFHYRIRERGAEQRRRNGELLRTVLCPDLLLGKIAIFEARKVADFVAAPDSWYRSDDRFQP